MARELSDSAQALLFTLRLTTFGVCVCMLVIHLQGLRLFVWELTVSGGLIVTYCMVCPGLALCATLHDSRTFAFESYLTSLGAILFALNAVVMWFRWVNTEEETKVVAELLEIVGVPVPKQIGAKVAMSAVTAVLLMADLIVTLLFLFEKY